MRERGVKLCFLTASSEARIIVPAPSEMPEALPAVTSPFFLNMDGSLLRLSMVALPPRGCSSISNAYSPFFLSLIITGVISSLNLPASWAACHKCCERSAYVSQASRVMPHCSPTFSAVKAMGNLTYWSLSADQSESSRVRSLGNLVPWRISRSAYGAMDMFSAPPHATISLSPMAMFLAPCIMDSKPAPQSLLTVRAGVSNRIPERMPTWRAR
mmetsp:Transcript_25827/g.61243  ORF Transcript_25827/g.61243 Transcript_25827/m.61243 type:complete len:214 (+) Transcript_25827:457-1098(+)